MSRKSRIGTGRPSALNCWGQVAQVLALPTINNSVLLFIIRIYPLFADWSRIALPVASFSEEEVKEVKGLVVKSIYLPTIFGTGTGFVLNGEFHLEIYTENMEKGQGKVKPLNPLPQKERENTKFNDKSIHL